MEGLCNRLHRVSRYCWLCQFAICFYQYLYNYNTLPRYRSYSIVALGLAREIKHLPRYLLPIH